MRLNCACGNDFDVPAEDVGKGLLCQSCGSTLRIVSAAGTTVRGEPVGRVIIRAGPHRHNEQLFLAGDAPIQVGKLPGSDIRLQGPKVSRSHCHFIPTGNGWRVEDANSTNGLFVNGKRTGGADLKDGDQIKVGDYRLRYLGQGGTEAPAEPKGPVIATSFAPDPTARRKRPDPAASKPQPKPGKAPARSKPPPPPPPSDDEDDGYEVLEVEEDLENDEWKELAAAGEKVETAQGTALGEEADDDDIPVRPARPSRLDADELVRIGRAASAPRRSGFWADVGKTFAIFITPGNLVMLVMVWFLFAVLPLLSFALCLTIICQFIIIGWLCAYAFRVIEEAAAGEDDLPGFSMTEGWWGDIVVPFFKFMAASLVASIPALAAGLAYVGATGTSIEDVTGDLDPPVLIGMAVSGFAWPITLLVVTIGGLLELLRIDLMIKTVARTIGPYLAICMLVAATWAVFHRADLVAAQITGGTAGNAVEAALAGLFQAYFGIVTMRIIGLYYLHYKKYFAWEWE